MIPEAREMATAIGVVVDKLLQHDILDAGSYSARERLLAQLRGLGHARQWSYTVDRTSGFQFRRLTDDHGDAYTPVVSVAGIDVQPGADGCPPVRRLDVSLELRYDHVADRTVRWHFDQANCHDDTVQPGPRFHLQFGGHVHQDRANDARLSIPRWSHPPMDLVLLLEVVAANFFEEQWRDLRDDNEWCHQIRVAQKLYFTHYHEKLQQCLNVSQSTFLKSVWADSWRG